MGFRSPNSTRQSTACQAPAPPSRRGRCRQPSKLGVGESGGDRAPGGAAGLQLGRNRDGGRGQARDLEPPGAPAPALARLFTPLQAPVGAYTVTVLADGIDAALARVKQALAPVASAGNPAGSWQVQQLDPLEAFGTAGTYDRSKVARLYAGRRVSVVRGPVERGGKVVAAATLISPYPDATLSRVESGDARDRDQGSWQPIAGSGRRAPPPRLVSRRSSWAPVGPTPSSTRRPGAGAPLAGLPPPPAQPLLAGFGEARRSASRGGGRSAARQTRSSAVVGRWPRGSRGRFRVRDRALPR